MKKLGLLFFLVGTASIYAQPADAQIDLIVAIYNKDIEGIKKALDEGAGLNKKFVAQRSSDGKIIIPPEKMQYKTIIVRSDNEFPLEYAVAYSDLAVVDELLKLGAYPDIGNPLNMAIVKSWASKSSSIPMIKKLLEAGADPDTMEHGISNLSNAAILGLGSIVAKLLKFHANPNIQNPDDGETPLMAAASRGHAHVVALLLENKATDPTIENKQGKTAADLAKTPHIRKMIQEKINEINKPLDS